MSARPCEVTPKLNEPFEPNPGSAPVPEPVAPSVPAPPAPEPLPSPPARPRGGFGRMLAAALLGGLVGGAVTGGAFLALGRSPIASPAPAPAATQAASPAPAQAPSDQTVEAAAARIVPSVVNIAVTSAGDIFGGTTRGVGSGIILRPDGYILTNNHVVEGATSIVVRLGTEDVRAKVVGTDPSTDLAVIKVAKTGLPAAAIGSAAALKVGETVVAVGSPFGLDKTVTSGIVSALHRSNLSGSGAAAYTNLIQTDASINPGNSGGALVDLSGAVVGVNTLIQSPSGQVGAPQSAGIGFAIPIEFAASVADQIIAGKPVQHPFLGIQGLTVDASFAAQYGLPVSSGAIIQDVIAGSPASAAGLKVGDIVVAANGSPVTSFEDLLAAIRNSSVGAVIKLEVVRGKEHITLTATLGSDVRK